MKAESVTSWNETCHLLFRIRPDTLPSITPQGASLRVNARAGIDWVWLPARITPTLNPTCPELNRLLVMIDVWSVRVFSV